MQAILTEVRYTTEPMSLNMILHECYGYSSNVAVAIYHDNRVGMLRFDCGTCVVDPGTVLAEGSHFLSIEKPDCRLSFICTQHTLASDDDETLAIR